MYCTLVTIPYSTTSPYSDRGESATVLRRPVLLFLPVPPPPLATAVVVIVLLILLMLFLLLEPLAEICLELVLVGSVPDSV